MWKGLQGALKGRGVETLDGHGTLTGADTIEVDGEEVRAEAIVLATGSVPRDIPPARFDGERIISSDHALSLDRIPERPIILGAGAIGVEFATVWNSFGADEVTQSDILHDVEGSPRANVVADLAAGDPIPSDAYDCVICTQTLQLIYDVRAAIRTLHRILKPGGVLLATVPTITQISGTDMERTGDYWRFTSAAAGRLFDDEFAGSVEIGRHGNVLAATAFLQGIATEELSQKELDHFIPEYEVLITIRAVKARAAL
jgi:SAM-dependent methyltransferase